MDNMGATTSSQMSPHLGNPLNPLPLRPLASEPATTTTIEAIASTPLEPVSLADEPARDVALASTKTSGHQAKPGLQVAAEHHKMDIDDGDEYLEKSKSCCSMLNKLYLALATVYFALFLCSIAYIIANRDRLNGHYDGRGLSRIISPFAFRDEFSSSERSITERYFNLTHPDHTGTIVVLSSLGASVHDILIPYKDKNGSPQYRSIVVKGGEKNHFGATRFGFDDPKNSMNMVHQLPSTYPFLNAHEEEWPMFASVEKPHRVRFVRRTAQIIYEFSSNNPDQFSMTTMVAPSSNEKIIADPTNNIYFNLRGHGDLSTHTLNVTSSEPIEIDTAQKMEQDRLMQSQPVDRLVNANNYFYKFDRSGLGKEYVATLTESETRTTMHVFSNHAGLRIDPFGDGTASEEVNHVNTAPDMRGIRISPRQSPVYEPSPIYGPTSVVFPSQAIHTTWWQFEYAK